MPQISDEAHAFLQQLFQSHLEDVLDDPSYMVHPDETTPPAEAVAELRRVCEDLGLDWDEILGKAHEHERERLLALGRNEDLSAWAKRYEARKADEARVTLRQSVHELLGDPSWLLAADRYYEPAKEIGNFRALAKRLGLSWNDLIEHGTLAEQQRLADIESGAIQPQPRNAD